MTMFHFAKGTCCMYLNEDDKGDFKQYRTGVKAEWSNDRMFNDSWLIGQMRMALVINKLFGLFDN